MTQEREQLMIQERDQLMALPLTDPQRVEKHLYRVTFEGGRFAENHLAHTKMEVFGFIAAFEGPTVRDSIADIVVVG